MDWQYILVSFLLNGVIAVILGTALKAAFDKELIELQGSNSRELARLSAELSRINALDTTRFTDLHQRRASAILELYRLLAVAERLLAAPAIPIPTISHDTRTPWQKVQDSTGPIAKSVRAVSEFFAENRILFTLKQAELMERIVGIFDTLNSRVFMKVLYREQPPEGIGDPSAIAEFVDTGLQEARAAFDQAFPQLRTDLEEDFRATLGFDIA